MNAERQTLKELEHIGRVVRELERMASSDGNAIALRRVGIMRPAYWRRRIDILLASGVASLALKRDADALRERLESLVARF